VPVHGIYGQFIRRTAGSRVVHKNGGWSNVESTVHNHHAAGKRRQSTMNKRPAMIQRRGMTMVLVTSVVAISAVLAASILATASLRSQMGRDSALTEQAQALADSGMDLACYYFQNPMLAPSLGAGDYWTGATGVNFGGAGTADINVKKNADGHFDVSSRGVVIHAGQAYARSSQARVNAQAGFLARNAVAMNGVATLLNGYCTMHGPVQSQGALTNVGAIYGDVTAAGFTNNGYLHPGSLINIISGMSVVPPAANLRDYSTYQMNGATWSAKTITSVTAGTVLGPTADNPAGVFKVAGSLTLPDNVTINGSLLVDGTLNVNGNVTINATPGLPALVVKNDIVLRSLVPRTLNAAGLSWVGGAIKSGSLAKGSLNFHGALLFGGSGSVDALYAGTLNVWSEPAKVGQTNLDASAPTPGVAFLLYNNRKDAP
jgi:hypothetical protein